MLVISNILSLGNCRLHKVASKAYQMFTVNNTRPIVVPNDVGWEC